MLFSTLVHLIWCLRHHNTPRKDGAFVNNTIPTMGLISSNLDPLNSQLDRIEKVLHVTKTQEKPVIVSRLTPSGDSDLVL